MLKSTLFFFPQTFITFFSQLHIRMSPLISQYQTISVVYSTKWSGAQAHHAVSECDACWLTNCGVCNLFFSRWAVTPCCPFAGCHPRASCTGSSAQRVTCGASASSCGRSSLTASSRGFSCPIMRCWRISRMQAYLEPECDL